MQCYLTGKQEMGSVWFRVQGASHYLQDVPFSLPHILRLFRVDMKLATVCRKKDNFPGQYSRAPGQ